MVAQILSIQVGLPKLIGVANAPDPLDRPWSTGFFKEPVQGTIWCGTGKLSLVSTELATHLAQSCR